MFPFPLPDFLVDARYLHLILARVVGPMIIIFGICQLLPKQFGLRGHRPNGELAPDRPARSLRIALVGVTFAVYGFYLWFLAAFVVAGWAVWHLARSVVKGVWETLDVMFGRFLPT